MSKTKVLITVTAYPQASRSYDDLVCTAGILEDFSWIRIYPVPLQFLIKTDAHKYHWIELDLQRRTKDFRPESYSPVKPDLSDLIVLKKVDTTDNWAEHKKFCLAEFYTNLTKLINDSKEPNNKSLATFKPARIIDFLVEKDEREWNPKWLEKLKQLEFITTGQRDKDNMRIPIKKVPYKFKYHFEDDAGKESKLMIEDWEIGQLFWNCLKNTDGDEEKALNKVRQKYYDEFVEKKDLYLFLGTTFDGHRRRFPNPFVIVGVFYPQKESQLKLF